MKSENYEICHDVVVSHVEAVIKSWEDLAHFVKTMSIKSKLLTRSICVIVCERIVDVVFEYKFFIWSGMKKKLYQNCRARRDIKFVVYNFFIWTHLPLLKCIGNSIPNVDLPSVFFLRTAKKEEKNECPIEIKC